MTVARGDHPGIQQLQDKEDNQTIHHIGHTNDMVAKCNGKRRQI
jgi:hypothetical protein